MNTTLLVVIVLALAITALFFWGLWKTIEFIRGDDRLAALARALGLRRADINPVLTATGHQWESVAVMNPAAVEVDGVCHLFYRAIGDDGVSRIGYAKSKDGIRFDRLPFPVIALQNPPSMDPIKHAGLIASGGSVAGAEDPRIVRIEDRVYLSFQAFAGWDSLRIGITSLSVEDLMRGQFAWTPPVYLSAPGDVQKNWVLFPEKINGKFAVFHGLMRGNRSRAMIHYLDSLDQDPTPYLSSDPSFRDESEANVWDTRIRGAGPPPLKTPKGWLLFYHANDEREPHRYKLGAMLLDVNDPSKVLARSKKPVLAPDTHYENAGKPGIVYACGAVLSGDTLRVYYGGADNVVCAAETSLSRLLKSMTS